MSPSALVEVGGAVISGMRARYSSVDPGELVALISSGGTLEVAERDGSASERLGVHRGARVCIRPERD
jgi:S-adenosylmethionine hydrolase